MCEIIKLHKTGGTVELSNWKAGPGPWQIVLNGAPDPAYWYIFHTVTQRFKRIGPVGAARVNNYDKAHQEALKRNGDAMIRKAKGGA